MSHAHERGSSAKLAGPQAQRRRRSCSPSAEHSNTGALAFYEDVGGTIILNVPEGANYDIRAYVWDEAEALTWLSELADDLA